jgi:hypothetical protein
VSPCVAETVDVFLRNGAKLSMSPGEKVRDFQGLLVGRCESVDVTWWKGPRL